MNRRTTLLTCTLLTLLVAGCVATPGRDEKGLLIGTQRVLALDFGHSVAGPRLQRLRRLPAALGGEMRRARTVIGPNSQYPIGPVATSELRRTQRVQQLGLQLLGSEAKRRPSLFQGALPTSFEFAENTANGIDTLGQLLGPGKRPFNEIDDYTHRTDHTDTRPVRTFWQRLRRRLPIW